MRGASLGPLSAGRGNFAFPSSREDSNDGRRDSMGYPTHVEDSITNYVTRDLIKSSHTQHRTLGQFGGDPGKMT